MVLPQVIALSVLAALLLLSWFYAGAVARDECSWGMGLVVACFLSAILGLAFMGLWACGTFSSILKPL